MFHLSDSLSILHIYLALLVSFVDCREILFAMGGCVGVKKKQLMLKKVSCLAFQKPLAQMSTRAPSSPLSG